MERFLQCGSRQLDLSVPQVMAILNATPDSFSDGGKLYQHGQVDIAKVLSKAEAFVAEGASIIDIGGESTRPGASPVTVEEELARVIPVVEAISARLDVIISVDTSQPAVINEAASSGAGFINDVRALRMDGALAAAAQSKLPVCLMHMKGDPQTMQHNPEYDDCLTEVVGFLRERVGVCEQVGIPKQQIIVDPGIGFGKRDEHNLALTRELQSLSGLSAGVLFGVSRKSMIGRLLNRELSERLPGSLALALVALQAGAKILRVHDVTETVDVVKIFQYLSLR